MRNFRIKDIPTTEYSYHPDIYAVQERTENRKKWYVINYSDMYDASQWTLNDAIAHYTSEEGKEERMEAFYRLNGFYD